MIKKLFLFTLLVSSFLVISCSNKDTTGATGTGVDSKWYGTYSGSATDPTAGEVTIKIDVNDNGITVTEAASSGESGSETITNDQISKVSDNKYRASSDVAVLEFTFTDTSVRFYESLNGSVLVDQEFPKI